jgi:hypothetical protein
MQRQEPRSKPEQPPEQDSAEDEMGSEHATPPIDEDMSGSVNAAVPETDD